MRCSRASSPHSGWEPKLEIAEHEGIWKITSERGEPRWVSVVHYPVIGDARVDITPILMASKRAETKILADVKK
jgi:hypothetical protein